MHRKISESYRMWMVSRHILIGRNRIHKDITMFNTNLKPIQLGRKGLWKKMSLITIRHFKFCNIIYNLAVNIAYALLLDVKAAVSVISVIGRFPIFFLHSVVPAWITVARNRKLFQPNLIMIQSRKLLGQ